MIISSQHWVVVAWRPINDRHLNEDLICWCDQVHRASPQLPDGHRLLFRMRTIYRPIRDQQGRRVALNAGYGSGGNSSRTYCSARAFGKRGYLILDLYQRFWPDTLIMGECYDLTSLPVRRRN